MGERYPYCRPCASNASRQWALKNAERHAENQRLWREAHPAATQNWRAVNEGRHTAINRRWEAAHPERAAISRKATRIVTAAIKRGDLTRPEACEECGGTNRSITAAHADYARPLDVRWLCRRCHSLWDHAGPKTLQP